tara:strand:+ start:346 stop:627 length:282 start_codon:yes stop_codon:yes gene_type:complete
MDSKISHLEFIEKSIKSLRSEKSKGIHVVYSGFNDSFRLYFNEDPIKIVDKYVDDGQIERKFVKGGPMIYLKGEGPKVIQNDPNETLKKILED